MTPTIPDELADAMGSAGIRRRSITLGGRFSKGRMGGPFTYGDTTISTAQMTRVLQYEPRDLTVSVEAGITYGELCKTLAEHRQMIPLDPPFAPDATIGGILATNASGPRRRLYGTARDLVIGMKFATLEGKLVQSGGMVVKNVAGLDMAKLMIGSFGTLAAIAVVNFKVLPQPATERSFLLSFDGLSDAIEARNAILNSALQPAAIDLLNPDAAARIAGRRYVLALQAGGNAAVIERYEREMGRLGEGVALEGADQAALWRYIQDYTPKFLEANADGAVVRVSCTLKEVEGIIRSTDAPMIVRAGTGVAYAYFQHPEPAVEWVGEMGRRGWHAVMEFSPEVKKHKLELWPVPSEDFELMKRVKEMFDPNYLLNRGRLYGRI